MTDDIVTRLKEQAFTLRLQQDEWDPTAQMLEEEAADEIERLRAEVARLASFLHPIGMVVDGQFISTSQTKWKRDE